MGCFSLLNIYEPKSLELFIKFQSILQHMNFFIRGCAGQPIERRAEFIFILKLLHESRAPVRGGLEPCEISSRQAGIAS
jgi:hypothetical protein